MILALAGGVGGAKLILGLTRVRPPEEIAIIGNTGDDIELFGLRVCPDLDTITYTLSGKINPETGWGVRGDTFQCLRALADYGGQTWFNLGDRDLATHLWRTQLLRQGLRLTEVTQRICAALGVRSRVVPMTDLYAPTFIVTEEGELHIQEYLVREQCRPVVRGVRYANVEQAKPPPEVEQLVSAAQAILICPSNPFISIGPILAVPGMKELLRQACAPVIAVSPIVGGRALKGPAASMLQQLGYAVSARAVAEVYRGLVDVFVVDQQDAELEDEIRALGMEVAVLNTVMNTLEDKTELARRVLALI